ncbi:MAG: hypothetical protein EXR79_10015 [Myxococcales bacterium]|nr:hypothetical protein [Myxococcales bacterium]
MSKHNGILAAFGALALIASGCEASTGGTDAAAGDATTTTDTVPSTDAKVATDAAAATDAAVAKVYKYVTIDGAPLKTEDCTKTSSPGADLDVVALFRGGKLQGVGKVGSALHKKGTTPLCEKENKHAEAKDVEGKLDTKMYTTATPDTGYFGLSNGSVQVQIGACTKATDDVSVCDGAGASVDILVGDELDVYEVDDTYKKAGKGPQSGIADDKCTCLAEEYDVYVHVTDGGVSKDGSSLGTFKGSATAFQSKAIKVK